jgi:hypothetical protein
MKEDEEKLFENELREIAGRFKYPVTPAISGKVRARPARALRLFVRGLAVALLLMALVAISVPTVRARLAGFFQLGAVRIVPLPGVLPTVDAGSLATPTIGPDPLPDLAGKTTLDEARRKAGFPILLPAYPADLGLPDLVYFQENAKLLILVWFDPVQPGKVKMSLHELGPDTFVMKTINREGVQETTVNGQYALWTSGPYLVGMRGNRFDSIRLVDGHTLIWMVGAITYRLETSLGLDEAIRIGESLR